MRTGGAEDSHTGEGEGEPHACGDGLLVGNSKSSIVVARASSRPQLLAFVRPRTRAAGRQPARKESGKVRDLVGAADERAEGAEAPQAVVVRSSLNECIGTFPL